MMNTRNYKKTILITGAAGFIGFSVIKILQKTNKYKIIGIDNLNSYYDVNLKKDRLKNLNDFDFHKIDLCDYKSLKNLFNENNIDIVLNLAAQAGVRYSIENPFEYIQTNLVGFTNILELSKNHNIEHFIYASSSSVYGLNKELPFKTSDNTDHPMSLYAATKKSNEIIAHSYSHLFNIPTTGLRFFTVYGPWGRPDMALYKFVHNIFNNKPIDVYNHGKMTRDFTYIDDIANGIISIVNSNVLPVTIEKNINFKTDESSAPYKIFNIGNSKPTNLMKFINFIEKYLNKKAIINYMPIQPGDVEFTYASTESFNKKYGFKSKYTPEVGVKNFIEWYLKYYNE